MPALNKPIDTPTFNLADQWCSPIDITNCCPQSCAYCTRYERHYRQDQRGHMSLKQLDRALASYDGISSPIGIIGGEPLVHPQFTEVCRLCRQHFPKGRLILYTAGFPAAKFAEYHDVIQNTFCVVNLADKREGCRHQPITLAVGEVCEPELADELIDACWVPRAWCKSINRKGAFFCEAAAALDALLDGPGGWPVEPGWWRRSQADCKDQRDRWCYLCGMCLPLNTEPVQTQRERITPRLAERFRALGLAKTSDADLEIVDLKMSRAEVEAARLKWQPWMNRWSDQ